MTEFLNPADRLALISPLDRRILEIEQAALFMEAATERWGRAEAWRLLRTVVGRTAAQTGAELRREQPRATLIDLWTFWQHLGGDGRLELELDELEPHRLRFRVLRCAYAEVYRARGLSELGLEFSCRRDEPLALAFLPGVRLEQSPTIMEGSPVCRFDYTRPEAESLDDLQIKTRLAAV